MNRKLKTLFEERDNAIYSVTGEQTIKEAVDLMNKHHIGALIVLEGKKNIDGIVSERDVMKKLATTDELVGHIKVKDIMTPKESLIMTDGECTIEEMMISMTEKQIRHMPIVGKDGKLWGLISMRDIIRILLADAKAKVNHLNNYITGKYPA